MSEPSEQRTDEEPFLVPAGWVDQWYIKNVGGPTYRILIYKDNTCRFEHRCDRGERGVVICAPELNQHHEMEWATSSINPSILCPDCGTHGFVREKRWVDA